MSEESVASQPAWKTLVAVVGPTASGKSDLALDLAERLPAVLSAPGTGAEIISADSMQFYIGMNIGTAKTPVEDRRGIVHHQMDTLHVTEEPSAAHYQQAARADIVDIHGRGNMALVAGGSGLYQRALLDVVEFPGTDPEIRHRFEKEAEGPLGARGLHAKLQSVDPESAQRIDPHNVRRVIRALEVIEITGQPYSSHMPRHEFLRPTVMLGVRRNLPELDERIHIRARLMFESGLLDEVRSLEEQGLRRGRTASKATGYAQALAVLDGQMSVEDAVESTFIATRQLARRQLKWLRPDPRVIWLDADKECSGQSLCDLAIRTICDAISDMDSVLL